MDSELKISARKFNLQKATSHDTEQAISPIGIFNRVAFCDSIIASQRSFKLFVLRQDQKKKNLCLRNKAFPREEIFFF